MKNMTLIKSSLLGLIAISSGVWASEGAWSVYLPGSYGDYKVAMVDDAGMYLRNDFIFYDGKIQKAVMQGRHNRDLELDTFINVFDFSFFSKFVLFNEKYGPRLGIGFKMPYYSSDYTARVSFDQNNYSRVSEDKAGLADFIFKPIMMHWHLPYNLFLTIYEAISMPTGSYDINRNFNIGRNYWAFDSNAAITWACPQYSIEVSAVLGYIRNTRNHDTKYETGGEFHLDYNIGYYIQDNFAVGLVGNFYDQVNGDNQDGALLGRSEASSIGIGPSMRYTFNLDKDVPLNLTFKLLYETDTENRYKGKSISFGLSTELF